LPVPRGFLYIDATQELKFLKETTPQHAFISALKNKIHQESNMKRYVLASEFVFHLLWLLLLSSLVYGQAQRQPMTYDGNASCGANFNGLGKSAGITIVEGHEFAETITDQFPNGGWLDSGGSEIGDKCAWNSATSDQPFGNTSYPVQPFWSNADNGDTGGCVLSY
jgi:hypothetical protein